MAAPAKGTMNLAARMGRWSAQHRKNAIWGWLAFVFLAFAIGGAVGTKTQDAAQSGVGESGRAEPRSTTHSRSTPVEQVLIQSDSATATDPSFRAVVADVQRRLAAVRTPRHSRAPTRRATRARSRLTGTRPCCASRSPVTTPRPGPGRTPRSRPPAAQAASPGLHRRARSATPASRSRSNESISNDFGRRWSPRCRSRCSSC